MGGKIGITISNLKINLEHFFKKGVMVWLNSLKKIILLSMLNIVLHFQIPEKYLRIFDLFFSMILVPLIVLYLSVPSPPPPPPPPSQRILQS